MERRPSLSSIPRSEKKMEHSFRCVDCQALVYDFSGDVDVSRDKCYNCMFVMRVADSAEQEAALRKTLNCERREPDDNSGV